MRREYQQEFRGRYVNGKIELLDKTNLEDGENVLVHPDLDRYRKRNPQSMPKTPGEGQKNAADEAQSGE